MSVNSCNSWLLSAHSSLQNYHEETYGERIAGIYDTWYGKVDDAVLALLRELAQGAARRHDGLKTVAPTSLLGYRTGMFDLQDSEQVDYYDFTLQGDPAGFFEVSQSEQEIYMNARFVVDGRLQENPFWVTLEDGRPVRCRTGDQPWREVPDGTYPASAYPLVLEQRLPGYHSLDEAGGGVQQVELQYDGDVVTELVDGTVRRQFRLQNGAVVWISWGGGAESRLKSSYAEAVAGTAFQ
jgi:hypothetical protein